MSGAGRAAATGAVLSPETLAGVGAIGLWAFLAVLSREAAAVPPIELTALAFTVSGGGGLLWLAVRRKLGVLRQKPSAWLHGVGGLAGYHALYFAALFVSGVRLHHMRNAGG